LFVCLPIRERDVESLYDYFGARYYDSRIGRFLTIDPRADKYRNATPYGYVLGNPLAFVDPNGDTVNLSGIRQYDLDNGTSYLATIIGDLQAQTGLTYSLDQTGNLVYTTDQDGNAVVSTDENGSPTGSAEARSLMIGAISASATANGFITPGRESGGDKLGFGLGPEQIKSHIEGTGAGLNPKTMGWGTTLMHELSHTTAGGGLGDGPGNWLNPGPIEARMNIIRSQLGADYGQRLSYGARSIDGVNYLPFGPISANLLTQGVATRAYTVSYSIGWRILGK
jgi:RHS repeat-associated protein